MLSSARKTRSQDLDLSREAALVRRAARDPDAFARLYDVYAGRVYRYAYARLRNHADAEDLTAQTFRRALEGLPRYQWRELPFGAWLFRIARNLCIDRGRAHSALSLDDLAAGGVELADHAESDADAALELQRATDAAWAAVATLPPLQRRAVVLRYGRDRSHAEVGVIIGRSEAATKQILYRAMKTLRVKLEANE